MTNLLSSKRRRAWAFESTFKQLRQSVEIKWQIPTNNLWPKLYRPCSQRIHLLIQICHFWKLFQSCREPGDLSLSFSKLYRFSPQGRSLGRKIWMSQVLLLELPWPSFSHKADFLLPFVFHLWKIILLLKGFVIDPAHSYVQYVHSVCFEGRLLMFSQNHRGKSEVWEICLRVLSVNLEIWIKKSWQWAFRM